MPLPLPRFARLALALLLATGAAHAMTVVAPSFDELVGAAESAVRGVVTAVRSEEFDSPQGRGVRTLVTLRVERTLKGAPAAEVVLSLLGGRVGRRSLRVVGMPEFRVGDREIVFFSGNGRTLCPLISGGHGRYHVRTDPATQRAYLARDNGVPLASVADVALPLDGAALAARPSSPATALAPAEFEAQVVSTVARLAARASP
jgi:hypothetical protein